MCLLHNILGYGLTIPITSQTETPDSRRKRLTNIISHANTHCPYYKDKYSAFVNGEKDFTDEEFDYAFSHLPIIDKRQLNIHNKEFCSDELEGKKELFTKDSPPSFWTLLKRCFYKKDFTTSLSLGGSSTQRWLDYHDSKIYAGSILHALNKNGWKRGQNFVAFMPKNSYFTNDFAQRNNVLYHLFGLTVLPFEDITADTAGQLLTTLKNTKATSLITIPHALQRIAHIMYEENIAPYEPLRYINISGAYFPDCNKTFIQTMFPGSDIQCSYGTAECGMIAHQSSLSSFDYSVLNNYVYLEQGSGNSILVTTYHQKAFPLIRYKIEDMGRVINYDDGSQKITFLEGRNTDYLIGADGYMYFPSFFNIFINELNKALNDPIIDFILRHKDDNLGNPHHLDISFVLSDHTKKEKIRKTVIEVLKPVFTNYRLITVSFPHHIEHDFAAKYKIISPKDDLPDKLGSYKKFKEIQPKPSKEQNSAIILDKAQKKKVS